MTYDVGNPDNDVFNERDNALARCEELRAERDALLIENRALLCQGENLRGALEDAQRKFNLVDVRCRELLVQQKSDDDECERLQKQVKDLREHTNHLVGQRRGIRFLVHEFHYKFGYPVRDTPRVPTDDEVRHRLRLVSEEFLELLDACLAVWHVEPWLTYKAREVLWRLIEHSPVKVDLPGAAHEMADLEYVIEGMRQYFGVNGWPVLLEVHRANMSKTKAALSAADGAKNAGTTKPAKPADFVPPDIAGVLRAQGWKPESKPQCAGCGTDIIGTRHRCADNCSCRSAVWCKECFHRHIEAVGEKRKIDAAIVATIVDGAKREALLDLLSRFEAVVADPTFHAALVHALPTVRALVRGDKVALSLRDKDPG